MFRDSLRGQLLIETFAGKMLRGRPLVVNEAVKKGKGPLTPKGGAVRSGPGGPRGLGGGRGGGGGGSGRGPFGPRGGGRPSNRPSSRPFGRTQRGELGGGPSFGSRPSSDRFGGGADRQMPHPSGPRSGDPAQRLPNPGPPSPPKPFSAPVSRQPGVSPLRSPRAPGQGQGSGGPMGPLSGRTSSRPGYPAIRRLDSPPPSPPPTEKREE